MCSHVFRGLSSNVAVDPIPPTFQDLAHTAVDSAKSIIQLVVQDRDLTAAFIGVPHYFHTMLAFACSFLLKTATKYRHHVAIDVKAVFGMIGQVVTLCKTTQCAQYHLIHWIGEGLHVLLSNCINASPDNDPEVSSTASPHFHTNEQFLSTLDTASQHAEHEHEHAPAHEQNMDMVWNAARQAALGFSADHYPWGGLYPQSVPDSVEMMGYVGNDFSPGDVAATQWGFPRSHTNMEHVGLGLGLL